MKKYFLKLKNFASTHKSEVVILALILLVGAFLRLNRISEYMTFLGDEGRDAIIVRNLLVHRDPILIGPGTSIGGMYLGPLYYYFMAPFLFLSNFSPVGPAIGVALLGVMTIFLVYWTTREWFGSEKNKVFVPALGAAFLYAVSPTVIIFSRASWNPNIMPFFSLVAVYAIWKVWKNHEFGWLTVLAISFAFVLQSHYLGLLLAPALFVFYVLTFWNIRKVKVELSSFIKKSIFSLMAFLFLMSPLVLFDFRHGFLNSKAIYKFFTVRQETVSIRPWSAIPKIYPITQEINTSLIGGKNKNVGTAATVIFALSLVFVFLRNRKLFLNSYFMVTLWFLTGALGFGLYKQHIYDHYFGFLFAAPFLIFGGILAYISKMENKFLTFVSILFFVWLTYFNLINNPQKLEPNRQMDRSRRVAEKISEESKGLPFNLAVLAERNYEDGYQYFLEVRGDKVVDIDSQKKETVTNQLFVACEMEETKCDPTHSPKAEVANFGWSKIENKWNVDGVIIYKLVHTN